MSETCDFSDFNPPETEIETLLNEARTVAVVGLSDNLERDSHRVAAYLQREGYRVFPVNPGVETILGEKSWPDLTSIPEKIDIVDIFRKPEHIPDIVDAAIAIGARAVWMQEGLAHNAAAKKARAAGIQVVQSRCMMKELKKMKGSAPDERQVDRESPARPAAN